MPHFFFNSKFKIKNGQFRAPALAAWLLLASSAPVAMAAEEPAVAPPALPLSLVGTWGCQSVYGGPFTGRACPTWPQLTLMPDGTYLWGSEKGQWKVEGGLLHLSGRQGTGKLTEDGRLVVEYQSQGLSYRQMLFKR